MSGDVVAGAGLAAAVFARPLATTQERVVTVLPAPLKRFYRTIGAGVPFDAPPWVAYNRIAGLLIMLFGMMVAAFDAIRP
jgi:hypothetical protein